MNYEYEQIIIVADGMIIAVDDGCVIVESKLETGVRFVYTRKDALRLADMFSQFSTILSSALRRAADQCGYALNSGEEQ